MKKALLILLFATILLSLILFFQTSDSETKSQKPRVIVSTFALYDIVKHLSGEAVELNMLIPFGVDIHAFEPTPKDMIAISKSSLFIYSGAGLEPWLRSDKLANNLLDMSKNVKLRVFIEDEDEEHEHEGHEGHHHEDNEFDPHYWLDIDNMILSAQVIKKELLALKLLDEKLLESNYKNYTIDLENLKKNYIKALENCSNPILVLNHNAFAYISARYNFTVESISGLSSDSMPSAKILAHIHKIVQDHNVSTIFYEKFVSDKMVRSVSAQTGAEVDFIQALGNISADDAKAGKSYVDFMQINLEKIAKAMQCH